MAPTRQEIEDRLARLKGDMEAQGRAVQAMIERAVDAAFEGDGAKAQRTIEQDNEIDLVDVRIEREAVSLLHSVADSVVAMDPSEIRMILTIVKVNNELERIADCAVNIAEKSPSFMSSGASLPPKFRVMANSVIGIMQTTNTAFARMDCVAAELVLASDDATEAFKQAILHDTLEQLRRGEHTVAYAEALQTAASNLGRMADHCTNIAEQVIYAATGKIVRHTGDRWTRPEEIA